MRKLIALALAASILSPVAASAAPSRAELQRDRAEIRNETRDVRQAVRQGDPRAIRDAREDLRDARHEYREDLADRRAYHNHARFQAPFGYTAYRPGFQANRMHYGASYMIARPWAAGLPAARPGTRWVRHYDDALLVDMRSGMIRRVVRNVF
ncbi:MAG TPA: RcnB family protein [Chakrabartia sp.]|nr:RcnB family protein [Chakrabartia sp.]